MNVQVLGISVDHVPCLKAWAESLSGINYPLLSDFWPHGEVAQRYGVLRQEGHSERAIFIVDAEGIIRYIDIHDIDLQPDNQVLFAELSLIVPGFSLDEFAPKPTGEPIPSEGLVVFCTPWCPECRKARTWLEANQISYIEVDVSKNLEAAEQVRRWTGGDRITPTFNIDGTVVVGWNQEKMEQMLLGK